MGLPGFDEFELWQTDADAIRAARLALDSVPPLTFSFSLYSRPPRTSWLMVRKSGAVCV